MHYELARSIHCFTPADIAPTNDAAASWGERETACKKKDYLLRKK